MTTVVNCRTSSYDVFIGRPRDGRKFHYGNPFSHLEQSSAAVKVASRDEAVQAFSDWLEGKDWQEVEPERRMWILQNEHLLRDKRLGCFCSPLRCHGHIYASRLDKPADVFQDWDF